MENWLETEKVDFEGGEFDPVLNNLEKQKAIKQKASARDWNISHQYADVFYAGTNTRPERVELERNLKRMINEGRFSYKFMEGYLISLGYQRDEITRAFKHLTGIHPYDLLNPAKFLATPASIPGISMGWGQAKDKTYDYYFINPYNWGFALFGQKGDIQRDVVEMYITSDHAIDGLKEHVKEANLFDQPLTKDVMKEFKDEGPELSTIDSNPSILLQAGDQANLGERAAGLYHQLSMNGTTEKDIKIMLEGALEFKHITAEEAEWIRKALAPAEGVPTDAPPQDSQQKSMEVGMAEKLMDAETEMKKQPFESEKRQITPAEYFDSERDEVDLDKAATDNVGKVLEYIKQKNSVLRNFTMRVSSFKYHGRELSEKLENEIQVPGQDIEQFFASNALLSVIVDMIDNTLPEEINTKAALLVFVIADGEVVYDDTFKGDDEKIYALTEEGLAKFFYRERQQSHETALGEL